jgi:hypothetical protein
MIKPMKIKHTITSAKTMMNAAPPVARMMTPITIAMMHIIAKIVNKIILTPPFHQRNCRNRESKYAVCQTQFPIVLSAMALFSMPTLFDVL